MTHGNDDREADPRIDMTPMIDCTFNLLIFFLCNIHFKALDGNLPTHLPRDVGMTSVRSVPRLEPLRIGVSRVRRVDTGDPGWTWDEGQIALRAQGRAVGGLEDLYALLRRVQGAEPELRVVLDLAPGALYVDAVKVLNECVRADATDIVFAGTASR
jgi:biopolymer transport protein ExbD